MPAAAIAAIGSAAGWTAATIATVTTITQVALFVGGLAMSAHQRSQAKKKARDAYNAAQVDRIANVVTTIAQRDLVLGRVRKGGAIYFRGTAGTNKETFLAHLALAGHEIDAVERVYLNDVEVTLNGQGYVTNAPYAQTRRESFTARINSGVTSITLPRAPIAGTIFITGFDGSGELGGVTHPTFTVAGNTITLTSAQPYASTVSYQSNITTYHARIWWELGSEDAVADARTRQLFPSLWSASHRGRGVAKLMAEFTWNESAFPHGVPVISAVIRGAKVYDPRTSMTAWSQNPALLARHVYQHPHFGKATVSAAEDERFIAAANACDTSHTYTQSDGASVTTALYRASLVVPFGTPARSAIDDLCQAMAGMSVWAGGEFYIKAGVYTAPVMTLTDADLAVIQRNGEDEQQDGISISPHRERAQKFNVVNARIWDSAQDYKQVGLQPYKAAALITRDGQELAQEMEMAAVFFAPQAKHVAGVALRDARDPLVFEAPFKLRAYPLELLDTIEVTLARYGWGPKIFMILGRTWDRERGVIRLTLKETAAEIYQPDAAFEAEGYSPNTALPTPWDIEPPEELTISSGTEELAIAADGTIVTRVRVSWPAITDSRIVVGGQVEVQWCSALDEELRWKPVLLDGATTETYLIGPVDGTSILVRARTRTELAVSDWTLVQSHTVIGKTEPPSDVATFSVRGRALEWPAVDDFDLAGYEVRFNYGTSAAWGTATPLHTGVITQSPWEPEVLPPGQITLLIKAKDTSGNYSNNAAAIVANLGDTLLENIVLSYDDKGAGFPGTKTNCTVDDGDLVADDSGDLYWGDDGADFWGAGSANFWPTATYLALTYELEHVVTSLEADARLTLDIDVSAESYDIEYRFDSQDLFWGDDADFMWERSDTAAFWPPPNDWRTWPGELPSAPEGAIQFRITTQAGKVQGVVSTLTLNFDVEDEFEELDDVSISGSGTRLSITKTYRAISNVQLTLQDDGGTAVTAFCADKDETLGPLIYCKDASGSLVTGTVDARIQGVKG
jgi:hypothetical protein